MTCNRLRRAAYTGHDASTRSRVPGHADGDVRPRLILGPDARFGCHPAIVRTRVGYAGGSTVDPTYHDLADHTEVFQLDFDPQVLSYEELCGSCARIARGGRAYSRQYMEVVLCADAEQEAAARRAGISVPIVRDARFYLAEDYHQKYYLRHDRTLMAELEGYTPRELVESRSRRASTGMSPGAARPSSYARSFRGSGCRPQAVRTSRQLVADRRGHL